jgi:hypothetical protein
VFPDLLSIVQECGVTPFWLFETVYEAPLNTWKMLTNALQEKKTARQFVQNVSTKPV